MRILIASGASGGHIFPALSLLEALEAYKDINTLLVLPARCAKDNPVVDKKKISYVAMPKLRLSLNWNSIAGFFGLLRGSLQSLFILLEFRPEVVVGFGTLDCLPIVLWAWLLRLKTMIHEQNVKPGRANKLLAKFVGRIAISFDQTKGYLDVAPEKISLTGNPLRNGLEKIERNEALNFFGFRPGKFTILVMGGSQGSHNINTAFLNSIQAIGDKFELQIVHLTGTKDFLSIMEAYRGLGLDAKVIDFLKPIHYAYSASDLVICRAGALTISEIIFFRIPAILIPYPYAYEHQLANAAILEKSGPAIIVKDQELDSGRLKEKMELLLNDKSRVEAMRASYSKLSMLDAARLLAEAAVSLA
jgi:UDP-N-acetylglucosamine--N-acetylmuramyl-(pentapeptide) pyrophosphoryl-undecaprenol N-acetylglucosamine transferase